MRQLLGRPKFWLVIAWILLPLNIANVVFSPSLIAILVLCVNVAVVTTPLWQRPRQ